MNLVVGHKGRQRRAQLADLAWAAGFCLLIAVALGGAATGFHQHLRSRVYHARQTRGAEPVDEHTANIRWIDVAADREAAIRRLWTAYAILCAATVLICIGLGAGLYPLVAALLALCGPGLALLWIARGAACHVGVMGEQLVLVDHRQMYHAGSGSRIQYRGPFLSIDDVVVYTGSAALPAFAAEQLATLVAPVLQTGARVDRKTAVIKLLEARHPLALGATATATAFLAAVIIAAVGQLL